MDEMYPSEPAATEKETPETVDEENEVESSKTTLVPKKALGGSYKVGDTVQMRVVADYGDEMELECCSDSEPEEETEMSADEEIESLDKG